MSSVFNVFGIVGYNNIIQSETKDCIYAKRITSANSGEETCKTHYLKKTELSEKEKLEAFKKEVWKEIDAMPWNSCINTSIQITNSAFKRMMNDDDFKNRMMDVMRRASMAGRPPITSCLTWIDENGYKGYSYLDAATGKLAFGEHSKHKDSFYVKTAKNQKTDDAWMRLKQSMEKHREMVEKEYLKKYYNHKAILYREHISNLYNDNILFVEPNSYIYMDIS